MKSLNLKEMEIFEGGRDNCSTFTGLMCGATVVLAFSTVFAPLAGATGVACLTGVAAGCTH